MFQTRPRRASSHRDGWHKGQSRWQWSLDLPCGAPLETNNTYIGEHLLLLQRRVVSGSSEGLVVTAPSFSRRRPPPSLGSSELFWTYHQLTTGRSKPAAASFSWVALVRLERLVYLGLHLKEQESRKTLQSRVPRPLLAALWWGPLAAFFQTITKKNRLSCLLASRSCTNTTIRIEIFLVSTYGTIQQLQHDNLECAREKGTKFILVETKACHWKRGIVFFFD